MSAPVPSAATDAAVERDAFAHEWHVWHEAHERQRADPHGFLAVTGLHWLTERAVRIADVPGEWSTGDEGPVVLLAAGEELEVEGATVSGRHAFGFLPERGGTSARAGDLVVEIARRGGHDIVRPRDPAHPFLAAYTGTPVFEADPRWHVPARFVAYERPVPTEVGAAVDSLTHVYDAPGEIEFTLDGATSRLVAFPAGPGGDLLVLFSDATSGISTYAANRAVRVAAPGADGATALDFTRAVNLPCAYTDFATCPLPPAQNRLPFAVEAGEKTPLYRVSAPAHSG